MIKLNFLTQKEKSVEVYKSACIIAKVKFQRKDFLKNYPKKEIDNKEFIKEWKSKESSIILEIEKVYHKWSKGEIIISFFPEREIFWKLPDYKRCFTFGLNNKAYIILYPTIKGKLFSFRILIHELFHANDVLKKKFGRVESKKHKWIEKKSKEIFKQHFSNSNRF
tara:strand:+ start:50 stop:547 length:498 start_codon:yes stop_codon:yes gene_type:complete